MRNVALLAIVLLLVCAYLFLFRDADNNSIVDSSSTSNTEDASNDELRGAEVALNPGKQNVVPSGDETEPDNVAPENALIAKGRVLDEARRPVASATIVARYKSDIVGRTKSKQDGTYELPTRPPVTGLAQVSVRASHDGRVARASFFAGNSISVPFTTNERKVAELILSRGQRLELRVVHAGKPIANAAVYARERRNASQTVGGAPIAAPHTDTHGKTAFELVSGEIVDVFIAASGYGRAHQQIALPADGVIDVELPLDRVVTVNVVHGASGEPVADAEVCIAGQGTMPPPRGIGCLPPMTPITTGEDGKAVIHGAPPTHIWVVARAPKLAMLNSGWSVERAILQKGENEITVKLYEYETLRFPIGESKVAPPANGTALKLVQYQALHGYYRSTPKARVEDGHVVIDDFPPGHDWGHVEAPNGTWAMWRIPPRGKPVAPIAFRHTCNLTVHAAWPDGSPARDVRMRLHTQPRGAHGPSVTNEQGTVTFERLCADSAVVWWNLHDESHIGIPVGTIALAGKQVSMNVTLHRLSSADVFVTIDGVPRLPSSCRLMAPPLQGSRLVWVIPEFMTEAPSEGRMTFKWPLNRDQSGHRVKLTALGYAEVEATLTKQEGDRWRADIALHSTSTLRVVMKRNEDLKGWLKVERWNERHHTFESLYDDPAFRAGNRPVNGVYTFRGFKPGRYRLVEALSSIHSDEFELVAGSKPVEIIFDVTAATKVMGRVTVPGGHRAAFARVQVAGRKSGRVSSSNPVRVAKDGSFELHARRGETLNLVAHHPVLSMRHPHQAYKVGSGEAVLNLTAGPTVSFQVNGSDYTSPDPDPRSSGGRLTDISVRFTKSLADLKEEIATQRRATQTIASNGRYKCKAPEPGRWSMVVYRYGDVPYVKRDIDIKAGETDLGTIDISKGATLKITFEKGEKPLPSAIFIRAEHLGVPHYQTSGMARPAGTHPGGTVTGLGEGRFRLKFIEMSKRDAIHTQEIDSDGTSTIKLSVRLP